MFQHRKYQPSNNSRGVARVSVRWGDTLRGLPCRRIFENSLKIYLWKLQKYIVFVYFNKEEPFQLFFACLDEKHKLFGNFKEKFERFDENSIEKLNF